MLLLGGALLGGARAPAQPRDDRAAESFLRQQRLIEEKLYEQRKDIAPLQSLLDWQWGGWLDYYIFDFNDGLQSQRTFQRPGLAVWTRLDIDGGAHQIFARLRLHFEYFDPGDEYDRQQDWVGPNFDRAWYQVNLGHALRLTRPADPVQARLRIGRQSVSFGTGYALDLPLDAVLLDLQVRPLRITGLAGKSIGSFPNVDRSEPVDSHMARRFFGVQVEYEGVQGHVPFAYALWNDDYTDERPKDPLQNYAYDTQYWGFGSRGSIVHNLNYWTEVVLETGRSYGNGNFLRRDYVDAWGWDAGLEYLFDAPMRPRIVGEYMFASGDSNRLFSPTSARGGNRGGREDTSFVAFGYRDTGLAAAPALSNIHIWRAGASLAPLEKHELFRDLEVGTNIFLYHKNRTRAAISDPTAGEFAGYVGWETDYFVNWRISSDLAWTLRTGLFFPGGAYQDQSTRHFLFTGLTWSF